MIRNLPKTALILFVLIFAFDAASDSQGTNANRHGQKLESEIKAILVGKGFEAVSFAKWNKGKGGYGDELLLLNVPFTTIYDHRGRTEFVVRSKRRNLNIRIEAKSMDVPGSIDEKLPYLYLNAIQAMPEPSIILVVNGKGWRPSAVEWLRKAAKSKMFTTDKNRKKSVKVMNLDQFTEWADRLFQ